MNDQEFGKCAERTDLQVSVLHEIFDIFEDYLDLSYDEYMELYDKTWADVDNVIYNFEMRIKGQENEKNND